ncbi:glutathione ABC transporter substrate-binding protein [Alteribacter aurantiacus]|uniref:glutathione ABC transporter substrate-binding protein n=1 Tax=Alteribacter aurantiacus TaxID=254410 RepID=UPI0003F70F3B|nr:glutathione ABC transporter substrate-binding protein [Alteribacter aurantiacus]
MKRSSLKWGIGFFALSSILVGCASEPDEAAGTEEKESEGGDLNISVVSDAQNLDPHNSNDVPSWNVSFNIYETLLKHDENMDLQPNLATDWEQVEDNLWEFQLEEGVTFHDGSEFNAEVVKVNFDRLLDEEVASPNAFLFDSIAEVNAVDDHTVEIVTEYPYAALPAHLAHMGSSMISKELIEEDYAYAEDGNQFGAIINQHPIGTGYFEFKEWNRGEKVTLTKNDHYWGEPAQVDRVTFTVSSEDLTRVGELESGSSHITSVSPSDVNRVNNNENAEVHERDSVSIAYLGFNTQKAPFDDKRVRQAISKAVNKQDVLNGIMEGHGVEAAGPLAEAIFGHNPDAAGLKYDPEKAKELLAEAGYEDGFDVTLWTNDSREREDIAVLVQAQLEDINVNVSLEQFEWGAYLDRTAGGEHDMFILGLSAATADADYPLSMLYHSNNIGAAGNRTQFNNEDVDRLIEEARREGDEEQRLSLYHEATDILIEEAPMLYLYHQEYLTGVSDQIEGFDLYSNGIYQLQNVTIN